MDGYHGGEGMGEAPGFRAGKREGIAASPRRGDVDAVVRRREARARWAEGASGAVLRRGHVAAGGGFSQCRRRCGSFFCEGNGTALLREI